MGKKYLSRKLPKKHRNDATHHRRDSVQKTRSSSFAKSVIDALVTKDEDLFFLTDPDGMIPVEPGHGLGLYYHDCRFLDGSSNLVNQARSASPESFDEHAATGQTIIPLKHRLAM